MDPSSIARVRRFQRTISQQLGVLEDRFLSGARLIGEARVVCELGARDDGFEVDVLGVRLGLDADQLGRVLDKLVSEGVIEMGPAGGSTPRVARLTVPGRAECEVLELRSIQQAASLIESFGEIDRARLLAAMAEVERLLTTRLVEISVIDPDHPHARHCLNAYVAELARQFDRGFDPARSNSATGDEMRLPAGLFVVAVLRGEPVGCGGLKIHEAEPAEIKRMWIDPGARGLGLGKRILSALEHLATTHGARMVRLETNRNLVEAIAMYRSAGYTEVPAFNNEVYAHHWFEKKLR